VPWGSKRGVTGPGSAGLSGWAVPVLSGRVAAGKFTAVSTKSALILPCPALAAGLAVAS
jgi:hypothetical protein